MSKKLVNYFMGILLLIGVIGATMYDHPDTPNAIAYNNIFMILLAVGLLGTSLLRWMGQRAKSKGNGKLAVKIASTAYLVFIVILSIWVIFAKLEKLGIL